MAVARASYPVQRRQRVSGMETWAVYQTDTKGRDSRPGRGNALLPRTPAAFGALVHPQKGTGACRHHHASRGLGPGDGSMRGTGSLCKDSPGHQQGRPPNGRVFSCPGGGRGMGNQNPSQIRPGATWVAKGSDIRKSPRLTQGSILLQSQAVRVVSVNGKQVPKSFLEETSLILVQGWPVEMQIHGHHPVNSGPPELAHSQVCPAIEAEVVWEPHREGP